MNVPAPQLHRYPDPGALYRAAADALIVAADQAIAARGRFCLALAGGGTPRPLYQLLATAPYRKRLDWSRIEVFFGDERCVPPDSERSNYRMAAEALLDHVPLPAANVHRMRGENDPEQAALAYAQLLERRFRTVATPRLDLVLLGLGDNGHTASLFPGCAVLRERRRTVCAQYVESQGEWRLSLTRPVFDAAAAVWLLAIGAGKADIVQRVMHGPYQPEVLPLQYLQPQAGMQWWLDAAAAARLDATI